MRCKWTLIVLLTAALCVSPCFGWGPDGHRIVGDIASKYLTDQAKAAVKDLLGDRSLADVSTWADEIRSDPTYDWAKPLHYVNAPRGEVRVHLDRDCPEGACVIGAINKYAGVLRDANAPREQRIEALKFLVHFVGDVHQPLHASYGDDRGGNEVKVSWLGQPDWNLHRVWDFGLIEHRMAVDRVAMTQAIERTISDRRLKLWRRSMNPVEWANESMAITARLYQQLPRNGQLDARYQARNIPIVEERLAMAGVRLAALLNDVFSTPSAPAPATRPAEPTSPGS